MTNLEGKPGRFPADGDFFGTQGRPTNGPGTGIYRAVAPFVGCRYLDPLVRSHESEQNDRNDLERPDSHGDRSHRAASRMRWGTGR